MKLELWIRPSNYLGASWDGYYVFLSQNRDSDTLTRSNFECALEQLGGRNNRALVIPYEKHFACGWIETILINKTNTEALAIAQQILDKLDNYPVLNEEHYFELDYAENPEVYQD